MKSILPSYVRHEAVLRHYLQEQMHWSCENEFYDMLRRPLAEQMYSVGFEISTLVLEEMAVK